MKQILLIEDNKSARSSLREFIENLGCSVTVAESAKEGFRYAFSHRPDLIMIDLNLPDNNGIEAIYIFRQTKQLSEIPILTISDDGKHGIELYLNIEKMGPGLIEYLTKPISFEELAYQFELILGKYLSEIQQNHRKIA